MTSGAQSAAVLAGPLMLVAARILFWISSPPRSGSRKCMNNSSSSRLLLEDLVCSWHQWKGRVVNSRVMFLVCHRPGAGIDDLWHQWLSNVGLLSRRK